MTNNQTHSGETKKRKKRNIYPYIMCNADNSHVVVEQKLEQYRQEQLLQERKKQEAKGVQVVEEENEDDEPKKKKAPPKLILCTAQTRYRVIKKACRRLDFKLNDDENADWDLYWSDTGGI